MAFGHLPIDSFLLEPSTQGLLSARNWSWILAGQASSDEKLPGS